MLLTLIGYRGTGKSTVAKLLAEQLKLPCWDSDVEIERRAGQSIKQIFAAQGEEAFRDWEERVIEELTEDAQGVLAVGGGAVLRESNRRRLARGSVIWLTAAPNTIHARVTADPTTDQRRPRLTTEHGVAEIETLLTRRAPLYRQLADYEVSTEQHSPEEVAAEIVSWLG